MKTGLFLAALVQLAAAQPHVNAKRQVVVTQVQTVTTIGPDVMVYVNAAGVPVSTSTLLEGGQKPSPATITAVLPDPSAPAPAPAHKHKHKHGKHHGHHHHNPAPAPAPVPQQQAVNPKPHKGGSGGGSGSGSNVTPSNTIGITYSPYNADGSCKSQGQVSSDFDKISGYGMVRIYGTDCDQVNTVGSVAKAHGMKIMAGIFDLRDIAGEAQLLISGLKSDWAGVDTISIGNELVNSGSNSASEVVAALAIARPILRAAGFNGNIVTVDTFTALIDNPELCQASDYAAANAHAFFDPTVDAAGAGAWAKKTVAEVEKACGKKAVITESGWPHGGSANGAAVPGVSQQQQALSSLKSSFSDGGIILFTAFDDLWKSDSSYTFGAEKFWGIYQGQ